MIWHGITLLSSLLLHYYFIDVNFLLYFEKKEKFCFYVWLQIFSTYCNLNYCSFVAFCVLILSLVLQSFHYWGLWGESTHNRPKSCSLTTTENQSSLAHTNTRTCTHTYTHTNTRTQTNTHTNTHTHTHTHTHILNNNFKVIT